MKNYMTNRPLSDMESDGVYFPEVEKEEELIDICHYSGLPSVMSYSDESETSNK